MVSAGVEHSVVLAELHARCFPHSPWDAKSISRILVQEPYDCLIYCVGSTPVGFVLWQSVIDEAEITTICIDPKWRRKGYSRLLIVELCRFLSQDQVSKLFLEVAEDNSPAINLYLNAGFEKIGWRRKYYQKEDGTLVDALVMGLDIIKT
ncbi:ribosomal-protein-alanine N-acetyltransferase [Rhodospirillales bacterium 47_12_T64]|nr:ribosomal-protein-alanine N-acetyltransferase [Rhodospirillales bacterium 47_12_T64]